MSFVVVVPEMLSMAATDLASVGSALSAANTAAAAPTTSILAAAGDEVSAAVAALFSVHAHNYQAGVAMGPPRPPTFSRVCST